MPPKALPRSLDILKIEASERSYEAYNACLKAESWASSTQVDRNLVLVRLIGWMMQKTPTFDGREALTSEVLAGPEIIRDVFVRDLGQLYVENIIRIFRAAKGKTPYQSHPSRNFTIQANDFAMQLDQAPKSHEAAKAHALIRDGYRCMVTRSYDYIHAPDDDSPITTTQCCHIISPALTGDIVGGDDLTQNYANEALTLLPNTQLGDNDSRFIQQHASNAWTVLSRFGGLSTVDFDMYHHKLYNILTLDYSLHIWFDELKLYFKATDRANAYEVVTPTFGPNRRKGKNIPPTVEFKTPDPERLPLPDPRLLHLHATCAEVAHLSGAAKYIEDTLDSMDEGAMGVLAEDGSSYTLEMAFARRADIAVC